MRYFLLDVFGETKYSGNQLAVVFLEKSIPDELMQLIASEFHLSETTFVILPESEKDSYRVRIFSPLKELPFAGHPTLGTAYIIRDILNSGTGKSINLKLNIGNIPVEFETGKDLQWMSQIEPEFGEKYPGRDLARILGVHEKELDSRFPVQIVSTGVEFLLVPIKELESVKKCSVNNEFYNSYFSTSPIPIFVFCPETVEKENSIHSRMFAPGFGIAEDPGTGSANGCLAGYLVHHEYFGSRKIHLRVEQGYEMNRKSVLHIQSELNDRSYNIKVGGKVIKIAEGKLF